MHSPNKFDPYDNYFKSSGQQYSSNGTEGGAIRGKMEKMVKRYNKDSQINNSIESPT